MKNIILTVFFTSALLTFASCGKEKVVFDKEYPTKNNTWGYADSLNFAFDITDTMALYDIIVHVKHREDYAFQNLYTRIDTKFPTGNRRSQILNLDLAENTGQWIGKKSGGSRNFETKIQENAFFNQTGQHVITLEQYMRADALPGIESIGLEVLTKGEKRNMENEKKEKIHKNNK